MSWGMDLEIDVSSPPRAPSPARSLASSKTQPRCVARASLELLHEALQPFIFAAVRAALGEELFSFYLPPDDADTAVLLRYVRAKWLAIFSDTTLEPHAAAIDRLAVVAADARRAINPLPHRVSADTVRDVESILIAIRKPALAARVAQLGATSVASVAPDQGTALPSAARSSSTSLTLASSAADRSYPASASGHAKIPSHGPQSGMGIERLRTSASPNMPVALDGSNIAWRHGASKRFSIRGVAEALTYFAQRGHPSVVFLPEARMRMPPPPPLGAYDIPDGEAVAFAALQSLEGGPQLVLTPEKDYDDCYLTHFARAHQAVVVSNDAFSDQVYQAEAQSADAANEWRRWLAACRLSYTFHGHAFVPNPVFSFERARVVAQELCLSSAVNRT